MFDLLKILHDGKKMKNEKFIWQTRFGDNRHEHLTMNKIIQLKLNKVLMNKILLYTI